MKKIAIIGAGISGLFIANLFKENQNYKITIFEKKKSIELGEGYGIQLSTNSIKLLNEIGFNEVSENDKFNPEKIDFYDIREQKKICDLNISKFNFENCKYTTLKRSTLIEFLKNRLDDDVIKYDHGIEKIEVKNQQISLSFNKNQNLIYDHLIISDGVFSKGKSLVSSNMNEPTYNNCIAIRGNISKNTIDNINEKNISLFVGSNFHYVIYPIDQITNTLNFIGILKYNLNLDELNNYSLFNDQDFMTNIKNNLNKKISSNMLSNINNIKCFPIFVSKDFYKPPKNINLIGDAFFAFPPSFAQGASQSIEGASELFDSIINNRDDFYNRRLTRVKMINNRSKLNEFTFHLSNPLTVYFRNMCLKILTKNNKFLENYLGKIYKN